MNGRTIGAPGRRALDMGRRRRGAADRLIPLPRQVEEGGPLPLVQLQRAEEPGGGAQSAGSASPTGQAPGEQVERVQSTVSPQAVADRVYRLLRRDLLWARERGGR